VSLQPLDSSHAFLDGGSATRNGGVKGVTNDLKVLWEVGLCKERSRGGHSAGHQVWVFLPVPSRKRARVGASKSHPGSNKTLLLPHGKREGSQVGQSLS